MSDLTNQVIKNTKDLGNNFNRKGSHIVTINGQEFYSQKKGDHKFWLTLDNDMEFVASMRFRFVCGAGSGGGGGGGGGGSNVAHGTGLYKTYRDFMDKYPPGTYVDVDGYYGAQCWDYGDAFWLGQVNRTLMTKPGGNGNACDCWNYSLDANKVGFTVISNWSDLKPGDWAFWDCDGTHEFGHLAMCVGPQVNGMYPFYGQNQGGIPVAAGGACVSQANIGPAGFLGALRYNGWA